MKKIKNLFIVFTILSLIFQSTTTFSNVYDNSEINALRVKNDLSLVETNSLIPENGFLHNLMMNQEEQRATFNEVDEVDEVEELVTLITNESPNVSIILDDLFIEYNDIFGYPFIDNNNRTQVPLRLTMEAFGAKVEWDPIESVASVIKNNTLVEVPIGESYVKVNGEEIQNETEAIIIDSRTYIPIRIVLEAFGAEVHWDRDNYFVIVNSTTSQNVLLSLPRKFDYRTTGRTTSVKNQGNLGTCWAFATLGALESSLMPGERWSFSEDHLSIQHGFNLGQNEGGEYNMSLAYLARWSGPIREVDDVYGDGISPTNIPAVKHLQEAIILPSKNYNEIKKAIYLHGGVQTSIYSPIQDSNFNSNYYNYERAALYNFDNRRSNHDVVIIGWDDDYPKENFLVQPQGNGAFIAKNSWGPDFGEEGYFYVSYYDRNVGINNIVYTRIDNPDNYDNIYQTDWLGWVGNLGYNSETAYFSNVYKTENREILRAVSFYATDDNTTYEIYYVDEFLNEYSLREKDFIQAGELSFAGYYTIDFEKDIIIEENTSFAVIVKITTPGASFPVAIEFNAGKHTANVVIDDGQGYISYDGHHWESTEEKQQSNVCLKAFTDTYIG
ncbi:C1A family cysteine protease [Natranaerovirga pectinivora]|uniref:C1A family cysteine protease n=1 Tax=Natranaerovirga pectinivora TaxID=682400 RepID=A0A4R3MEY6_9FIRM|nr:lectin like domain-containing protein [Natranaerovirga pectinivora]TCT11613.1 C1A family cysteine protease [Natranaerovirga pectinivora]